MEGLRTRSTAGAMTEYREAVEAAVARVAEAGEGGEAYRHLAELLELFSAGFAREKERRAGLDFEDLQLLAARLLEGTEVGGAYRERFSHLLVDEFQDTNRLQLRLVEALRGPDCRLMVVGDELQSIYGFRHADLDVFREQRAAIEADPASGALALSGNFRSRPELIGAVNAIGERLLGDAYRPLRVGAVPEDGSPADEGPAVELLLTGREGWDREEIELEPAVDARTSPACLAEARFLATRLRELADAGVERGAMVVLLRAFRNLDAYEDSLERAGLRPYVVGGRGYWSQQQVADVGALLATIANPLDDQALFGALASPACGVTPDTLWLLRAAAGHGRHVWPAVERLAGREEAELEEPGRLEAIPPAEQELLRRFAATIDALRRRAPRLPLAELIDAAIAETGYDLAVLMRPSGEARFANLRKLMRLAAEFESSEGRDLRGLLDFLAARSEADADAEAATALEGHDGVRIMTVHSAKGLEFDVVAVPDLAREPLAGSTTPVLPLGRGQEEPRVGMQAAPPRRRPARPLLLRRAARGGVAARRRRGAAAVPRRGDAGAPAAAAERRRQGRAGARDDHADAGGRADRRRLRGRARTRLGDRGPGARAARRPRRKLRAFADRRPRQPRLARAGGRADGATGRGGRRAGHRRGASATGRAATAGRPQPPALLHRARRLPGLRLPLLHGARPRPERGR